MSSGVTPHSIIKSVKLPRKDFWGYACGVYQKRWYYNEGAFEPANKTVSMQWQNQESWLFDDTKLV